jgi:hypothetical protein
VKWLPRTEDSQVTEVAEDNGRPELKCQPKCVDAGPLAGAKWRSTNPVLPYSCQRLCRGARLGPIGYCGARHVKTNSSTRAGAHGMQVLNRIIAVPLMVFSASLLFAVPRSQAAATAVYVAQAQAGAGDGSSCQNAKAVSFLNSSANWGSGTTQIGPGTAVHLCGTITTALSVSGSGNSGSAILIQWEPGASLQVCSTIGAFVFNSNSHLTIDLGGNSAAILCPNNGTGLASSTEAIGIYDGGNGAQAVEVRNGTIGPMYVHSSGSGSGGSSSLGIWIGGGGSNNLFHDLKFTDAAKGILFVAAGASSSGNQIYRNNFLNTGSDIYYACGGSPCNDAGAQIFSNDFTVGANWLGSGVHQESIHIFANGPGTSVSGLLFYNNYMHGAWPSTGGTSHFEVSQGGSGVGQGSQSGSVFDNICVMTGGSTAPGDGCFYVQNNDNVWSFYNNTVDCVNNANNPGIIAFQLDTQSGNSFTVKNNIVVNCNIAVYDQATSGTGTASYDRNIYFNIGSSGANGWWYKGKEYYPLATWQSATGQDLTSKTTNPGLNSDYTISGASSGAYQAGNNLWSLSLTPLDTSKPASVGEDATAIGIPRSSTLAWDLGAYAMSTGSAVIVNPPTNLTATVQ